MDKRRVNIRAIIWRGTELLAVKHKSKNGGESDYWCLPGGGLDPFESLEDGLKRELIEETGITAHIGHLLFIQQLRSTREHRDEELEFFFHVTNTEDFRKIDLGATSHGALELTRCEFIDPRVERILPEFLQTVDIAAFINEQHSPAHYTYLSDHA